VKSVKREERSRMRVEARMEEKMVVSKIRSYIEFVPALICGGG
jgi:hypothetical protein